MLCVVVINGANLQDKLASSLPRSTLRAKALSPSTRENCSCSVNKTLYPPQIKSQIYMGNKPTKPAVKINFKEHFKIQKETIFNKEITKGAKPVKGRMMQSGYRDSVVPHINHQTLERRRTGEVQVNQDNLLPNHIRNPKFSHQAGKKALQGAMADNRTKAAFEKYPYTCIGMLQVQFQNKKIRGTAFLISSNWLLTCAHNFYIRGEKKMGTSATLTLGLHQKEIIKKENGKEFKEKIDVGDVIEISTWRLPEQYIQLQNDDDAFFYDFALVKLKNFYDLEQKYGYFGLDSVWSQKTSLIESEITIAGFPNESKYQKGKCKDLMQGKGPWTEIEYETEDPNAANLALVEYKTFTSPGQSGSPIFYETKQKQFYMIGIHTLGGDDANCGVLITPKAREMVNGWIQEMKTIFDISNQNIGDEGMEHFIDNFQEISTKITELQLANNRIGPSGIAKLMVPKWTNLKLLNLENNNIKLEGAKRLGDPSNGWLNLTYLNFNNTLIGDEGCCKVLENRKWAKLKELHLKSCCLTSKTINEMVKNEWGSLETLHLGNNDLKYQDIRLLFSPIPADENNLQERKRFKNLRHLNLNKNPIGNNGLEVIVKSDYNLESLNITDTGINPTGMEILKRRTWEKLKKLHIDWNKTISIDGIKNVTPTIYPFLSVIKLDWTTLGAPGVKEFMRHDWKTLKNLSLNNNYLGDNGLNELKSHGSLQVLVLQRNNITTQGVMIFANKQEWKNLMQLKLRSNHIKKQGFNEIIMKLRNLNHLDINNNGLDAHQKRELKELANSVNPNLHIQVDMGEEADYST